MTKVFEDKFPAGLQGNKTDGYYMNELLKSNLDVAKKVIEEDWDMCILCDGTEGGGKSVLMQQCAYYCDPTFDLSKICFTPDEFRNKVLNAKRYEAVIFDEAYAGLSSRSTMSATNKILVDMMTEIRQKNLFIFIVLPTFFDLDKYVALWRSRCLIHVYHDNFKRGFFDFYSYGKKKDLYVLGKKYYNYRATAPDFKGRFTDFYPVNKEEYKAKKLASLRAYAPTGKTLNKQEHERLVLKDLARHMFQQKEIPLNKLQISKLLGVDRTTIYKYTRPE